MLKPYDKLEDVPEALREHYKLIDGKYVPEISDDHPVKVNNVKLLNEKTTAETKASGLETANAGLKADLESAKAHSLPRGHRAVPVADVEAMEKLKEHGTAAEIVAKLTEHGTLKADVAKHQRDSQLRTMAKDLGYDNVEAFVRLPALPDFERRDGKDGKPNWIAKLKDDKGAVTEKPANEFIESSPDIAPFLPALKASEGVRVHTTAAGVGSQPPDPFAWAREYGKQYSENAKPVADLAVAFNERKSA